MKRHCFTSYPLFALIGLMLSSLAVVHASPPFDYEQWRRDHPRPAGKRLADLDVGEPRTVRMIYFVPKGKSYSQEVVDRMKAVIGRVQTFYAEQMEAHGYGNLTFRFEIDAQGEPVVHRVDGKHPSSYYTEDPIDEISEVFDLHRNVYFIIAENDLEWPGSGERLGKNGGYALLDESYATTGGTWYTATTAHELGHAFGLHHDFRDDRYIMSYGYGDSDDRLSASAAEFLSVHPYFNPAIPIREGPPPSVELMSSQKYPAGSKSVSVRLQVRDPTGIHQVCLQTQAFTGLANEVTACRGVSGKKDAVVEFEYDGVIPSSTWLRRGPRTSLSDPPVHEIQIMACDIEGNANGTTNDDAQGWRYNLVEGSPYEIASLEGSSTSVHSLSFSPDGALLAFLNRGEVRLWDVAAQESVATLDGGQSVAFSPDGTLAVGSENHTSLWNVANRQKIATLKGGGDLGVTFSLDGSLLASTTGSTVWLWDVATRTEVGTLAWHDGAYFYDNSLSFSPDGVLLASLYWKNRESDRRIRLWDVATQKSIATLDHGRLPSPTSVVFSPDGTTLASGHWGFHRTVALWDVETWEQVAILERRGSGVVESVAFSPDGRLLASAGGFLNNTVRLWDVQTRQELVAFGHTDPFYSLSFSLDGLLAAGSEETIILPNGMAEAKSKGAIILYDVSEWTVEPQARLTPDPAEVEFHADDPAWKTFTVHTNLDSVLVRANPSGSDPAIEVSGGQQAPTRDYCPAEGNDRPTSGRRDGWNLHVKACQAGQTKILLIDYDTDTVLQQYEVNVEASTSAAASTALNPNYPNPFNSETVLSYTLPTAADIRLEVFTLSGQRVAVLHEGFQAAGYHTIAMDASDLASGVYLYRLTTPEGRFTQKFTLLR